MKRDLRAGAFAFCLTAGIMMPFAYDKWTMPVPLVYFWFGIVLFIASIFIKEE